MSLSGFRAAVLGGITGAGLWAIAFGVFARHPRVAAIGAGVAVLSFALQFVLSRHERAGR